MLLCKASEGWQAWCGASEALGFTMSQSHFRGEDIHVEAAGDLTMTRKVADLIQVSIGSSLQFKAHGFTRPCGDAWGPCWRFWHFFFGNRALCLGLRLPRSYYRTAPLMMLPHVARCLRRPELA